MLRGNPFHESFTKIACVLRYLKVKISQLYTKY